MDKSSEIDESAETADIAAVPEAPAPGGRAERRRARDRVRRRNLTAVLAGLISLVLVLVVVVLMRGSDDDDTSAARTSPRSETTGPSTTTATTPVTTTPVSTIPITTTPVTTTPATVPAVTPAVSRAELRPGMSGSDVVALQQRLIALGYKPGTPDGNFGESTADAVKAFQTAKGLPPDAIVGPRTWDALNAAE